MPSRSLATRRRLQLVAGSLRLIAIALETATHPNEFRGALLALENSIVLVNMCCFDFQKHLIQNSKNDIDSKEVQP